MKGLLHSKRFKSNLGKWLCMYVGVLLLLTTVVTYSKFISNMQGDDDESKPAKFNVDVIGYGTKLEETPEGTTIYDAGLQRPNAPLTYYLKINTEFEVATSLSLNATIQSEFNLMSVTELKNGKERLLCDSSDKDTSNDCDVITTEDNNKYFVLNQSRVYPLQGNPSKSEIIYKIVVKYDNKDDKDYKKFEAYEKSKSIIDINYRAEQIIK